ncbi:MAG TPA: APC family permease [Candidatus Acidoferrales bacterium]|nr:APC family permease [Candidatus Acidoferrales bacterium]
MEVQQSPGLVRAMGRWTLTALVINSIIGSGIFGLPSVVAGYLGNWSPFAYLIGALAIAVVMACLAEVASQFDESGGPYLYAREAFGRFAGIETGWLSWLSRSTAVAAAVNLFVNYLAQFWPAAQQTLPRFVVCTALIGTLAFVNYRGVKSGAAASNVFTVAKLSALFAFAAAGGVFVLRAHASAPFPLPAAPAFPLRNWFEAMLAITFAYGGFESAVVPMAEARNPRRDAPVALFTALLTTTLLYCLIQYVIVTVLPFAAATDRPLALAAQTMWGTWGASLIAAAALVSVYGFLSAHMLNAPRLSFALGEHGDFPPVFSRIHSRYRTPHASILIFAGLVWSLAVFGNFKWNVMISSVSRLFVFTVVCAALPLLRRKRAASPAFRLPAGNFVAAMGVVLMLVLVSRMRPGEWAIILTTMAIALLNWLWARNKTSTQAGDSDSGHASIKHLRET